jgi:UDP-glucose 4-epimerase
MTLATMRVMVTGGAGYVGSHFVRALRRAGHTPVVVDDLSSGHRDAVPEGVAFRQGSVENDRFVRDVLDEQQVDAVAHFAARIQVGESVRDPRRYYRTNLLGTIALVEAMLDRGVRTIVATSSAAVYGERARYAQYTFGTIAPCREDEGVVPDSPYGETKLAVERALAAYHRAYGLRYAVLRCFNIAGAETGLAERHDPETHLIPLVLAAAESDDPPSFVILGGDYPTPDGTAVRDYVHVAEVAGAHLMAINHLRTHGASGAFNVGSGRGYSVRDVVAVCDSVTGKTTNATCGPRREGDPPYLVADVQRARDGLHWEATVPLQRIVRDAWESRRAAKEGA